jgi:hypothetical protein
MRAVFPAVYALDVAGYDNTMVIGATCSSSDSSFDANANTLPDGNPSKLIALIAVKFGNIRAVAPGGRVFTDDKAPVELVIDEMIVDEARKESSSP